MKGHPYPGRRHPQGTSLAESVVTIFLIGVLTSILAGMFILLLRSYYYYSTRSQLIAEASSMIQRIGNNFVSAYGVEPTRAIGVTTYSSDDDSVILKLASIDASGNPISNTFDYLVVSRDPAAPEHLLETTDANAASARSSGTKLFGEHLADIAVLYKDGSPATSNEVLLAVTVSKMVNGTTLSYTLHTHAKLRNK